MIKPVSKSEIPPKVNFTDRAKGEIQEFIDSGNDFGEVVLGENDKTSSRYTSYKSIVKMYQYPVKVFMRQGRIFLERTDKEEQ